MVPSRRRKVVERQLALRERLWPKVSEEKLWIRQDRVGKYKAGFTTMPKTIPLILDIMDDLANGKRVSKTYLELWCRAFDECFVTLSNRGDLAFYSGFAGQRGERTWVGRMRLLHKLKFIDIKPGPSGELSYALIWNPYHVIKSHHKARTPGLTEAKYNALLARASEI
ncbi:MAG: hypothetical protein ACKVOI_13195 [Dongiaceae bacterium]